jgi:hypothetical protein
MKNWRIFGATAALALTLLAACVPSVHPLYTEKDLVQNPALSGSWTNIKSSDHWAFEAAEGKSYQLVQTDPDGRVATFSAHLLKLDGVLFLDVQVTDLKGGEDKLNEIAQMALIPGHLFFKVEALGPDLKLAIMNPDWLGKLLEKSPKALAHIKTDHAFTITASTKELQRFFRENRR